MNLDKQKKFRPTPITFYPVFKFTDTIFIRKTDEKFAKQLVKFWTDTDVSSLSISLKCPITMSRLNLPCRGEDCTHLQCFDGYSFLKMNEKQFGKWLCNICQKPSPLNKLYVDGLVLDILRIVSKDIDEVYFDENGNWNDIKQDIKDISVIDLSETLEVIDLTGSDDENTPLKSGQNGKSNEECINKDQESQSKNKVMESENKNKDGENKNKDGENKENEKQSCDTYPKSISNIFVDKNITGNKRRLPPYSQTDSRKQSRQTKNKKTYNLRRPLHDQTHRYNNCDSVRPNQVIVNLVQLNPNIATLNTHFSGIFNVVK